MSLGATSSFLYSESGLINNQLGNCFHLQGFHPRRPWEPAWSPESDGTLTRKFSQCRSHQKSCSQNQSSTIDIYHLWHNLRLKKVLFSVSLYFGLKSLEFGLIMIIERVVNQLEHGKKVVFIWGFPPFHRHQLKKYSDIEYRQPWSLWSLWLIIMINDHWS